MTVSSMSRYVLDSYYNNAASSKDSSSSSSSTSNTSKSTSSYSARKNNYSKADSYAALFAMSGMGKNAVAKKTADSSRALANSTMNLVSASNYRVTARGSGTVDDGTVSKVKKFVEDYNNTVNSVKLSDNVNALRYGVSMVDTTKAFKKSLAKVGITIEDNNNLTVDEDKLKNANLKDVQNLFSGSYSYGSRMVSRSLNLNFAAKNEIGGTYNSSGYMNNYANNIINTILSTMA